MLGIVIGVAAVIAMVAIGSGARNLVDRQIRSLGANLAIVTPGNVTQGGARLGAGAASSLTDEDAHADPARDRRRGRGGPFVQGGTQVGRRRQQLGDAHLRHRSRLVLPPANGMSPTGRGFDPEEVRRGDIVVILGQTVARNLFGEDDPIGQTVRVRNVPFRVVGVMAPKGNRPSDRIRTT